MNDNLEEQTHSKNKKKLILQNSKLHGQLIRLQREIDAFDQREQRDVVEQPNFNPLKRIIEEQERQIKQIREIVDVGRHSNTKENAIYIQKDQDELIYLKKQLQNLMTERQLISLAHQDKVKKLSNNDSLQRHKDQIQRQWTQTKKQNRETNLKLVQMQRQIRKYHNIKQRSKNKNGNTSNQEIQLANIQSQITRMNIQMKSRQEKWKPNADSLDHQFFQHKNNQNIINKKLQQLQKEQNIWKLRAANLRDNNQIEIDRQRLSKLPKYAVQVRQIEPVMPKKVEKSHEQVTNYYHSTRVLKRNDKNVDMIRYQVAPIKVARESVSEKQRMSPVNSQKQEKIVKNMEASKDNKKSKEATVLKTDKDKQKQKNSTKNNDKPESIKKSLEKQQFNVKSSPKNAKAAKVKEFQQLQLVAQQNKNNNNWSNRKQKQKVKNLKSNEAEIVQIVKAKVQEAKKMNKKVQRYEEIDRSPTSPQKHKDKARQASKEVILSNKQKINTEKAIFLQKSPKQISSGKASNLSKLKLDVSLDQKKIKKVIQISSQNIVKKQQEIIRNNKKIIENSPKEKVKVLTESLNLKIESPRNKQQRKQPQQRIPVDSSIKKIDHQTIMKHQQKKQTKIHNNHEQKPLFEISIRDVPHKNVHPKRSEALVGILNANILEEEEMEGIPKIVKRRKVVGNELINTGTST